MPAAPSRQGAAGASLSPAMTGPESPVSERSGPTPAIVEDPARVLPSQPHLVFARPRGRGRPLNVVERRGRVFLRAHSDRGTVHLVAPFPAGAPRSPFRQPRPAVPDVRIAELLGHDVAAATESRWSPEPLCEQPLRSWVRMTGLDEERFLAHHDPMPWNRFTCGFVPRRPDQGERSPLCPLCAAQLR